MLNLKSTTETGDEDELENFGTRAAAQLKKKRPFWKALILQKQIQSLITTY